MDINNFVGQLQQDGKLEELFDVLSQDEYRAEMRDWLAKNLLAKKDAIQITGQSDKAFSQSVTTQQIFPFYVSDTRKDKTGGGGIVRLFMRTDLERYAEQLKRRKEKWSR
jgi:hypothetical protein